MMAPQYFIAISGVPKGPKTLTWISILPLMNILGLKNITEIETITLSVRVPKISAKNCKIFDYLKEVIPKRLKTAYHKENLINQRML